MSEYQPTSIVLAKVKGYPAWPAMVLDESLLPEHISNKNQNRKPILQHQFHLPLHNLHRKRNLQ